jgi:hypothetical protein
MPLQRNPFFWAAITAMQIAPVSYGNAQVIYFSVEFVKHNFFKNLVFYCETPIPKAQRSGIAELNNPAKRRVLYPSACFGVHTRDYGINSIIGQMFLDRVLILY